MKYIRLTVIFKTPLGMINCLVAIKNEFAILTFKNLNQAREFYANEKASGSEIKIIERTKSLVQRYKDKTKEEILEIIQAELKKAGGSYTTQKVKGRVAG